MPRAGFGLRPPGRCIRSAAAQLPQEAARSAVTGPLLPPRPRQVQALPCSRDTHIEQAALLLDALVILGVADRQQPLAEPDEVDARPLEALRRVDRRQRHGALGRLV